MKDFRTEGLSGRTHGNGKSLLNGSCRNDGNLNGSWSLDREREREGSLLGLGQLDGYGSVRLETRVLAEGKTGLEERRSEREEREGHLGTLR